METILSIRSTSKRENQVKTTEVILSCVESGFPICLSEGLLRIFGSEGKKVLDRMVMNRTSEPTQIDSQTEICNMYERYIGHLTKILGESTTKVIELESFKLMQDAPCAKCPLYERQSKKVYSAKDPIIKAP